jgi:hypothetical protein
VSAEQWNRPRPITNPQHIDEIRARVAFTSIGFWRRLTRRAPTGWRRY